MTAKLDAVIFDFDGVLVDSMDIKTSAFAELYTDEGEDIQKRVVEYHLQNKGISRYRKIHYFQSELLGREPDDHVINELAQRFASLVKEKVIAADMIPGALESLQSIYEKAPLYVASGTPDEEMHEIILGRRLQHFFRGIHGSPKSKTEIVRDIIKAGGFLPPNCVMVGDAMEDYHAASSNNCEFVGVAYNIDAMFPQGVTVLPDLTRFVMVLGEKFPGLGPV